MINSITSDLSNVSQCKTKNFSMLMFSDKLHVCHLMQSRVTASSSSTTAGDRT